ncbi:Acetokinase family-domain-containing protein [Russula dissimulans]|nr:Acetokinase family-domain-containing protein [Russula dissimulans]
MSHDKSLVAHVGVTEAEDILNEKSGWQALADSSDFGEIIQRKDRNKGARLAYHLFVDRILNRSGRTGSSLAGTSMRLSFAGGIGEKGKELRESVVGKCTCLGFAIDRTRNEGVGEQEGSGIAIGKDGQKRVLVCRTDEQGPKFWKRSSP